MRALVLQHVPFEGSARIGDWIGRHCEHEHVCYLYADAHLPALDSFDLLVVMGGPMSVHDEAQYPWLVAEKRLIRAALDAGKKVLGICLGAQLLAQALGAAVRPGRQAEIGWWPLHRYSQALGSPLGERLPERLMAFHWHGETFDLPAGSVPLYGSAACANQGFIWNEQAIGLQCHLKAPRRASRRCSMPARRTCNGKGRCRAPGGSARVSRIAARWRRCCSCCSITWRIGRRRSHAGPDRQKDSSVLACASGRRFGPVGRFFILGCVLSQPGLQ